MHFQRTKALEAISSMAAHSLRCIGLATAVVPPGDVPEESEGWKFPGTELTLLAILGIKVSTLRAQPHAHRIALPPPPPLPLLSPGCSKHHSVSSPLSPPTPSLTVPCFRLSQDPCRPGVPDAVARCQGAGVKVREEEGEGGNWREGREILAGGGREECGELHWQELLKQHNCSMNEPSCACTF